MKSGLIVLCALAFACPWSNAESPKVMKFTCQKTDEVNKIDTITYKLTYAVSPEEKARLLSLTDVGNPNMPEYAVKHIKRQTLGENPLSRVYEVKGLKISSDGPEALLAADIDLTKAEGENAGFITIGDGLNWNTGLHSNIICTRDASK